MNGKAATRKEDKSINGITISDKEFKVSHFADNTSLLLEGDIIKILQNVIHYTLPHFGA